MTKRHRIDERVSLAIPDDWEVWEPPGDVLFAAAAPEVGRDELQPHLFVIRDAAQYESSRDALAGNTAYLQDYEEGYVEHDTLRFDVDGHEVACVVYDAPTENWVFRNRQYFLIVDGWEYLVTCKMLPEQAARWSDEFDRVVRSFEIGEAE